MDHPKPPTTAMASGTAAHEFLTDPMGFIARHDVARQCEAITGKGDRCTNGGKVRVSGHWFCGVNGHTPKGMEPDPVEVVSEPLFESLVQMQGRIQEAPAARAVLDQPGGFEVSVLWPHAPTGLMVKSRADFWSPHADVLVDYKKTRDASPGGFSRAIGRYGYHRQGAMYLDAFAAVGAPLTDFVFIAQEEEEPWALAVYRLHDSAVEAGRHEYGRLLATWKECEESGAWPAYDTLRIQEIALTTWDMNRIYEEAF
jgi:hypothetical protein